MENMPAKRPNVLYLHCHDAGRYVQPYGHPIPTPSLQRFAEQGILFRKAFTTAPTCSPSRAALLTGQHAHCAGMLGLAHRGFRLNDYRQHLVHTLREAGYVTALAGIQHEAAEAATIGYEHILATEGGGDGVTAAAVDFLHQPHERPFFMSVGYFAPHRGTVSHRPTNSFPAVGPPADERYVLPPAPIPDTPQTRRDMAEYIASMQSTDLCFGRVLNALDRTGLADHTLVIVTTDHGIAFPMMKCRLTDHGMGVMLILRGPARSVFRGGRVIDAAVTHLDVFPTLCEFLDLAPPAWLQGKNLLPLVEGNTQSLHDAIFSEVSFHASYEAMRAIRTDRWKFIQRFDNRDNPVLPNCDDSLSKVVLQNAGWAQQAEPRQMLFDLVFDPMECANLAFDSRHANVVANLQRRLHEWMESTNDPLCRGPISPPPGAIVTDANRRSPKDR